MPSLFGFPIQNPEINCLLSKRWVLALILGATVASGASAQTIPSQPCAQEFAPKEFSLKKTEKKNKKGYPENQGIVPHGFVGYKDGTTVVHGVDVSKWQSNGNFKQIRDCGGKFAYVRLSAGMNSDNELEYRVHWANARSAGLLPGPYHFLTVPALSQELPKNEEEHARYLAESAQAGASQAEVFISRLREVLALEPALGASSKSNPFLPPVLALGSIAPMASTAEASARYGKYYVAAACKWLDVIRDKLKIGAEGVMVFTYPYIYNDYGFEESSCALSKMPLWIAGFSNDGGRFSTDDQVRSMENKVCVKNGSNRCRFQLYSSYGGFAQFDKSGTLDLDRFHGTEQELNQLLHTLQR